MTIEKFTHTAEGENKPEGVGVGTRVKIVKHSPNFNGAVGTIDRQHGEPYPSYWFVVFDRPTEPAGYRNGWFKKEKLEILG